MVQISMIIVNMALSMRNDYGSDKVIFNKSKLLILLFTKHFTLTLKSYVFMYLINRIEGPQAVPRSG